MYRINELILNYLKYFLALLQIIFYIITINNTNRGNMRAIKQLGGVWYISYKNYHVESFSLSKGLIELFNTIEKGKH